jgi:hypothetical protein
VHFVMRSSSWQPHYLIIGPKRSSQHGVVPTDNGGELLFTFSCLFTELLFWAADVCAKAWPGFTATSVYIFDQADESKASDVRPPIVEHVCHGRRF